MTKLYKALTDVRTKQIRGDSSFKLTDEELLMLGRLEMLEQLNIVEQEQQEQISSKAAIAMYKQFTVKYHTSYDRDWDRTFYWQEPSDGDEIDYDQMKIRFHCGPPDDAWVYDSWYDKA